MNQTNFIELLSNFVEQRPGFDWANYDSMRSYRSDYLPTLKDKKTFFDLVEFGLRCFGFEQLNNKLGQYLSDSRKRLTYTDSGLQYCTGQYYPVEYRAAAKNAIFYCIWDLVRENYPQYETGEQIRQFFKRETRNREILRLANW